MSNHNPPVPSIALSGYAGLMSARMRGLIFGSDRSLEDLERETEIEPKEFRQYFANTHAWTIDDIERVASALGVDLLSLFKTKPGPDQLTVGQLIRWRWQHYGVHVSVDDILEAILANIDLPPHEQWYGLVARCDEIAIEATRGNR